MSDTIYCDNCFDHKPEGTAKKMCVCADCQETWATQDKDLENAREENQRLNAELDMLLNSLDGVIEMLGTIKLGVELLIEEETLLSQINDTEEALLRPVRQIQERRRKRDS